MENSDNEMEEDESEWKNSFVDSEICSAASGRKVNKTPESAHRVILHFDLDCFYAQVEMIRNPALRDVPLGIQQKYIIVTCNYVARDRGVTKLMSVTDAIEKCPDLVLVKGEDLTHYREMSYKVTELLVSYCPLVERLGFDENFMDVSELVDQRFAQTTASDSLSFIGHVYKHFSGDVKARDHPRLALGSHIAAELREAIHSELGLTGCAGIATNKLLAKLISGTFKPNQQTVLLQENISDIMGCLSGVRKVPGVGHQTAKRLQALGLVSVNDLQLHPLNELAKEFGVPAAQRLKHLAVGFDDSPVTPTGAPQVWDGIMNLSILIYEICQRVIIKKAETNSLSDEDSFKKMSSTKEVLEKIQQLLTSLVDRMQKDGRQPQTFRLTIRRYSVTNKWFNRESRQSPISNHLRQKITSGNNEDTVVQLLSLAMKLFHKMVDSSAPFHLTLINVCFSNLQTRAAVGGKGSITSFFTQKSSPRKSQDGSCQNARSHCLDPQVNTCITVIPPKGQVATQSSSSREASLHGFKWEQSSFENPSCSTEESDSDQVLNTVTHRLPPNVDPDVFKLLPEEIQKELLSPTYLNSLSSTSASHSLTGRPHLARDKPSEPHLQNIKDSENKLDTSDRATAVNPTFPAGTSLIHGKNVMEEDKLSFPKSSDCKFPGNVDPEVFSELPPDVQRELMAEWKQQKPILKTPSSRKTERSSMNKDRKSTGKSSQSNNLFNYFKPS